MTLATAVRRYRRAGHGFRRTTWRTLHRVCTEALAKAVGPRKGKRRLLGVVV